MSPTSNSPPGDGDPGEVTPAARRSSRRQRPASSSKNDVPPLAQLLALPTEEQIVHLVALPQHQDSLWAGGRLATPRTEPDCPHGTDCCAWIDARNFRIYALDLVDRERDMECLVQSLVKAMAWPNDGREAFRPARVVVADRRERRVLEPLAQALGIAFVRRRRAVEELVDIVRQLTYQPRPTSGLLGREGVTPEIVQRYFAAAARFYRRPPRADAACIKAVRIEGLEPSPLFVCVTRRCASAAGATIFLDEDPGRHALTVIPCSRETLSPHLLDEARQRGWRRLPEGGYPLLVSGMGSLEDALPTAEELILATRVLRILNHVDLQDSGPWVRRGRVDRIPVRVEWPVDLPRAQGGGSEAAVP